MPDKKPKVKPLWIVLAPAYEPDDREFYGVVFGDRCKDLAERYIGRDKRRASCRLVRGWHVTQEGK